MTEDANSRLLSSQAAPSHGDSEEAVPFGVCPDWDASDRGSWLESMEGLDFEARWIDRLVLAGPGT